jgi:hypothetical protein
VVRQLPVQMLVCQQLYADEHYHGGALHRCQYSTPFVPNGPMQFFVS